VLRTLVLVGAATFVGRSMAQDTPAAGSVAREPVAGVPAPRAASGHRSLWPGGYAGVCYPIWCGGASPWQWRKMLERQRRLDELRKDPAAAATGPAAGPWDEPQGHYLPPPTPEKQIQPAYRDRSVVRPEFRDRSQELQ